MFYYVRYIQVQFSICMRKYNTSIGFIVKLRLKTSEYCSCFEAFFSTTWKKNTSKDYFLSWDCLSFCVLFLPFILRGSNLVGQVCVKAIKPILLQSMHFCYFSASPNIKNAAVSDFKHNMLSALLSKIYQSLHAYDGYSFFLLMFRFVSLSKPFLFHFL